MRAQAYPVACTRAESQIQRIERIEWGAHFHQANTVIAQFKRAINWKQNKSKSTATATINSTSRKTRIKRHERAVPPNGIGLKQKNEQKLKLNSIVSIRILIKYFKDGRTTKKRKSKTVSANVYTNQVLIVCFLTFFFRWNSWNRSVLCWWMSHAKDIICIQIHEVPMGATQMTHRERRLIGQTFSSWLSSHFRFGNSNPNNGILTIGSNVWLRSSHQKWT